MTEDHIREITDKLGMPSMVLNSSGWLVGSCPFAEFLHDRGKDVRPSFFIHVNTAGTSGFNCYSCKQTGTVSGLVRKLGYYRGVDYSSIALDAELNDLPDTWGDYSEGMAFEPAVPIEQGDLILDSYPPAWGHPDARDYLLSRGIRRRTTLTLDLRFDEDARRIVFPVKDRHGSLYGMTGRSIIPNAVVKIKDYLGLKKAQLLLGEHLVTGTRNGVVVEGLFGLGRLVEIGVIEHGWTPVATMGAEMSDLQADRIIELFDRVALIYDDDQAGDDGLYGRRGFTGKHSGKGAISKLIGQVDLKVPYYPKGVTDIDQLTFDQFASMLNRKGVPLS